MSELPEGWRRVPLERFISLKRGYDLPKDRRARGNVPVVGSGGISGYHDIAIVRGPGVTIGRAANIGVPAFVEQDFWPLNTTLYVTDFHGNDERFAFYLLKSLNLSGYNSGSVQPMLNRNYIRDVPVVLPDPMEQREISAVLGALDQKIALGNRISDAILRLVDAEFEAVLDGLGDAPGISLGELSRRGMLEFGDGYRTKSTELASSGLPILRVADIQDGRFSPILGDRVGDSRRSAMGNKISQPGDVVVTTKGTVGRVVIMPVDSHEFVYSPQLCFFRTRPDAPFSNHYLFAWFRSREFWRQARGMKSQTDMADYLSLGDIRSLVISVPAGESERRLSRTLKELLGRLEASSHEARVLADLRDALLPKLISGRIRVKNVGEVGSLDVRESAEIQASSAWNAERSDKSDPTSRGKA